MRFFSPNKNRKRLLKKNRKYPTINQLLAPLGLLTALVLSGCGSAPRDSASTSPQPQTPPPSIAKTEPAQRGASRGGLSTILGSTEQPAQPSSDKTPYASDSGTVWERLRSGYKLDWRQQHASIEQELKWYRSNPAYLYRASERASRYLHYVVAEVQQRNLPTELALLPIVESAYDPFAYSRSGAAGIWQFVPATGQVFGLKQNWWYDGRKDVVASTQAALNYLQYLHNKFGGDWLLAVAAYNFGEGSIQRAVEANRKLGKPVDFWSLQLRDETRTYVPKLLALARIVNAPHNYGINLYAIPNEAYFAAVETRGQIDLAKAASLARVDIDEVYRLNPGFHHWATDPQGPQRLLLPVAAVDRFTRELAALPAAERVNWNRYQVQKGDTLAGIGRRFNSDVAAIRSANQLRGDTLKPGQSLLVPEGGQKLAGGDQRQTMGSRQVLHTVQSGENILRISQRYGVTIGDVRRWNGLNTDSPVKLGQKLSIWTDSKTAAAATAPNAATAPIAQAGAMSNTHNGPQKVGYTVRSGDSLHAIASKFNLQVGDILRWNNVNPSLLQPGQQLTLYLPERTARR